MSFFRITRPRARNNCRSREPQAAVERQSYPDNAVAVVDGTVLYTKADLETLVNQTKNNYKATDRAVSEAATPEYQNLQTQWVQFLVQTEELRKAAAEHGDRRDARGRRQGGEGADRRPLRRQALRVTRRR